MKKKFLIFLIIVFSVSFIGLWSIVSGGYDKQNKFILILKEIIPSGLAKKVRDTVFIIPDLKEKHKHPSLPGNYPLKLKVSLTLFITFLNNLPEQDSGSIRGLIDKLPTRIKIEIYRNIILGCC